MYRPTLARLGVGFQAGSTGIATGIHGTTGALGLGMNGIVKRLIVDRPGDRDLLVRRRYAAVAGVLYAGASLCTLASSLALETAPAMTAIGLAAFGLLLSFLSFVVPWERVGSAVIDLSPAAATLAVAIATTTIDPTYGFYLVLVAGFVAYSLRRPAVIGGHLALIAVALVAPIVLEPEGARKAIACGLIFGPGVILVTTMAIYLRRSTEAREAAYREFATDALALASRIRARVGGEPIRAPEWFEAPAPALPLRNVGIAKVVRTQPANGAPMTAPAPAPRRLPMTAVAVAASVIAVISTTAAVIRDGGDQQVAATAAPVLARDALPAVRVDQPSQRAKHVSRHRRDRRAPATEAAAAAPATTAGAPAAPAESGGDSGGSQPAAPATPSLPETPVPVRPQTGEPEPQSPPPTPVQHATPAAGPVESAAAVVEGAAPPVVAELKP